MESLLEEQRPYIDLFKVWLEDTKNSSQFDHDRDNENEGNLQDKDNPDHEFYNCMFYRTVWELPIVIFSQLDGVTFWHLAQVFMNPVTYTL